MSDYIAKPIDPEALQAALVRCGLSPAEEPGGEGAECDETAADPEWRQSDAADWDRTPVRVYEEMSTRDGESLALTMVKLFRTETAGRLDEVERCFDTRDADELEMLAHKLAGSAANIGAVVIREAMREIENLAADHGWAGVPEEISRARDSWLRLEPLLADYVVTRTQAV